MKKRHLFGAILYFSFFAFYLYYFPTTFATIGPSMTPTIVSGDKVIAFKRTTIERFDIVIIRHKNEFWCKRVVGLPGEDILVIDNILFVNDKVYEEPYVIFENKGFFASTLKKDEYFVMGDNRENSSDSRSIGPVKVKDVLYEVKIIIPFFR